MSFHADEGVVARTFDVESDILYIPSGQRQAFNNELQHRCWHPEFRGRDIYKGTVDIARVAVPMSLLQSDLQVAGHYVALRDVFLRFEQLREICVVPDGPCDNDLGVDFDVEDTTAAVQQVARRRWEIDTGHRGHLYSLNQATKDFDIIEGDRSTCDELWAMIEAASDPMASILAHGALHDQQRTGFV